MELSLIRLHLPKTKPKHTWNMTKENQSTPLVSLLEHYTLNKIIILIERSSAQFRSSDNWAQCYNLFWKAKKLLSNSYLTSLLTNKSLVYNCIVANTASLNTATASLGSLAALFEYLDYFSPVLTPRHRPRFTEWNFQILFTQFIM